MNVQHSDIVIKHIKTKNKIRKIVSYRSKDCELRNQHERINRFLAERFIPSVFTKGYVKHRSIYHNALSHMYNDCFIMLDIKDFFPSICHHQLEDRMFYEINLMNEGQISRKECRELVSICSISGRGLPLGFITSPILSNIYMKEFDGVFFGQLKKQGLSNVIYTRYADDITVSYQSDSLEVPPEMTKRITMIATELLKRYGLQLNPHKTRSYSLNVSNHVRITGVNITKQANGKRKLTVGRTLKNELYWSALECLETKDPDKAAHVKGMQSFVLSIEKTGYEGCYSSPMMKKIYAYGYASLKELIDDL